MRDPASPPDATTGPDPVLRVAPLVPSPSRAGRRGAQPPTKRPCRWRARGPGAVRSQLGQGIERELRVPIAARHALLEVALRRVLGPSNQIGPKLAADKGLTLPAYPHGRLERRQSLFQLCHDLCHVRLTLPRRSWSEPAAWPLRQLLRTFTASDIVKVLIETLDLDPVLEVFVLLGQLLEFLDPILQVLAFLARLLEIFGVVLQILRILELRLAAHDLYRSRHRRPGCR